MSNSHLQRGLLLFQQQRFSQAADELRQQLLQEPDDCAAHALLALCLNELNDFGLATEHANQAISAAPDAPHGYYALARIMLRRNRLKDAELAILEAIRVCPTIAEYFGWHAVIQIDKKAYREALATANRGLECNPEDVLCLSMRIRALELLGIREAANEAAELALERHPDQAISHASMGWTLLRQRESRRSCEHFMEALRLNPNYDWARAGLVEAIKSRNFFYRQILSRTALAPLGNVFFRFHSLGRHALSIDQIQGTYLILGCLIGASIALAIGASGVLFAFPFAAIFILLLFPASAVFECKRGWPRWTMGTITTLLCAFIAALGVTCMYEPSEAEYIAAASILTFFMLAMVSRAIANVWLIPARPKK